MRYKRPLSVLGVRNSVGGDVDPRTGKYWLTENARDWISDDRKLNMINKIGEHFGYPYCHQGNLPDEPEYKNNILIAEHGSWNRLEGQRLEGIGWLAESNTARFVAQPVSAPDGLWHGARVGAGFHQNSPAARLSHWGYMLQERACHFRQA
jgi:glucose/arabinose dehydrogenase